MKAACGHVFKYGDNVDTDVIIPARCFVLQTRKTPAFTVWKTLTKTL